MNWNIFTIKVRDLNYDKIRKSKCYLSKSRVFDIVSLCLSDYFYRKDLSVTIGLIVHDSGKDI